MEDTIFSTSCWMGLPFKNLLSHMAPNGSNASLALGLVPFERWSCSCHLAGQVFAGLQQQSVCSHFFGVLKQWHIHAIHILVNYGHIHQIGIITALDPPKWNQGGRRLHFLWLVEIIQGLVWHNGKLHILEGDNMALLVIFGLHQSANGPQNQLTSSKGFFASHSKENNRDNQVGLMEQKANTQRHTHKNNVVANFTTQTQ